MKVQGLQAALLASVALSLSACGGGGGGGVGSTPFVPTPTPTPTPTPGCTGAECLEVVHIFPAITETTDFAELGLEASGNTASLASLKRDGFAVSYNAEAGVYIIDVPSSEPGGFYVNTASTPNDRFWNGEIAEAPANVSIDASVFQPRPTNPVIQLTYTTYAMYGSTYQGGPFGYVAFGSPTPGGAVPLAGNATYDAAVEGATLGGGGDSIKGSATLQFDFGAGTLAGHFEPVIYDLLSYGEEGLSLGSYDFINTVYSAGSTSFSGELSRSGLDNGAFQGLFTGPAAQELMARWTAPFLDPRTNTTSTMFGIWVGKRGP